MREISFIGNRDYVLFLPSIYFKQFFSYKKFNISRKDFIGSCLQKVYKSYFSNSYSVFWEYLRYYKKEFDSYKDFLDSHYNLTDIELDSLNSITLRCSQGTWLNSHNYLLNIKNIRRKLEDYLGGEFFDYED
ncbi:MAG: hypothetical protein HDR51_01880 [Treponema sp.]|nr:hypothetical protein [Treponema sp.]